MPERYRRPTLRITCNIWTTIPSTIRWIQSHRDSAQHLDYMLLRGINANIILLSATCIEGFLVEALKACVPSQPSKDPLLSRLTEEFYERAHTCSGYDAAVKLFPLATGRPLSDAISDGTLQEAVSTLFTFRNGLAHGRSTEYRSYVGPTAYDYELEFWGSYNRVETYLLKVGLLKSPVIEGGSGWDLLASCVADHFVGFVEPYCRSAVNAVAGDVKEEMESRLQMAFVDKLRWV